jgi:hypothetical protein
MPQVQKVYAEFQKLTKNGESRRTSTWEDKVANFHSTKSKTLFDISTTDKDYRFYQEQLYGVTMTETEWSFLSDQGSERKMFCDNFVDRKWKLTKERQIKNQENLERRRLKAQQEKENYARVRLTDEMIESELLEATNSEADFHPEAEPQPQAWKSLQNGMHIIVLTGSWGVGRFIAPNFSITFLGQPRPLFYALWAANFSWPNSQPGVG